MKIDNIISVVNFSDLLKFRFANKILICEVKFNITYKLTYKILVRKLTKLTTISRK